MIVSWVYRSFFKFLYIWISPNHQIWPWTIIVFNVHGNGPPPFCDCHWSSSNDQVIWWSSSTAIHCRCCLIHFVRAKCSVFLSNSTHLLILPFLVASKDRIKSTWMIRRTWTSQALDRCRSERIARKNKWWWFSIRESEQSGPSCLGVPKWCIRSVGFADSDSIEDLRSHHHCWNLITNNRSYV